MFDLLGTASGTDSGAALLGFGETNALATGPLFCSPVGEVNRIWEASSEPRIGEVASRDLVWFGF